MLRLSRVFVAKDKKNDQHSENCIFMSSLSPPPNSIFSTFLYTIFCSHRQSRRRRRGGKVAPAIDKVREFRIKGASIHTQQWTQNKGEQRWKFIYLRSISWTWINSSPHCIECWGFCLRRFFTFFIPYTTERAPHDIHTIRKGRRNIVS